MRACMCVYLSMRLFCVVFFFFFFCLYRRKSILRILVISMIVSIMAGKSRWVGKIRAKGGCIKCICSWENICEKLKGNSNENCPPHTRTYTCRTHRCTEEKTKREQSSYFTCSAVDVLLFFSALLSLPVSPSPHHPHIYTERKSVYNLLFNKLSKNRIRPESSLISCDFH